MNKKISIGSMVIGVFVVTFAILSLIYPGVEGYKVSMLLGLAANNFFFGFMNGREGLKKWQYKFNIGSGIFILLVLAIILLIKRL